MKLQYPFVLRGSDKVKLWSEITNNQWQALLPPNWKDKGFHFYKRMRQRGSTVGINTPSDLESEILKGTVAHAGGSRYEIDLLIRSSEGQHLKVYYDFENKQCQLVTMSY